MSTHPQSGKELLRTDRGLIKLMLLSLITIGIYSIWFQYKFVKDLNVACAYDGKHTQGLIVTFLLSIITLGIYGIVWVLMIVSRVDNGAIHYGRKSSVSVGSFILWNTLGTLIIVGPIVAGYQLLKTMNEVCTGYNNS